MQHVTVCPFRVVDEINQGMDQINERKVIFAPLLTSFRTGDNCTGHVLCLQGHVMMGFSVPISWACDSIHAQLQHFSEVQ